MTDNKIPTIKLPEKNGDGVFYVTEKKTFLAPNDKTAVYTVVFVPEADAKKMSAIENQISAVEEKKSAQEGNLKDWKSKGGRGGLISSAISEYESEIKLLVQKKNGVLEGAGGRKAEFAESAAKYEVGAHIPRKEAEQKLGNFSIPVSQQQAKKALKPQTY